MNMGGDAPAKTFQGYPRCFYSPLVQLQLSGVGPLHRLCMPFSSTAIYPPSCPPRLLLCLHRPRLSTSLLSPLASAYSLLRCTTTALAPASCALLDLYIYLVHPPPPSLPRFYFPHKTFPGFPYFRRRSARHTRHTISPFPLFQSPAPHSFIPSIYLPETRIRRERERERERERARKRDFGIRREKRGQWRLSPPTMSRRETRSRTTMASMSSAWMWMSPLPKVI